MQRFVPHLWYDGAAEEAARLYAGLVPGSSVGRIARFGKVGQEIHGQPEGQVLTVEIDLGGTRVVALNGGPAFRFAPSFSLFVALPDRAEVDRVWAGLIEGGAALMPLDAYPWSPRYGWLRDRWGLGWQICQGDPAAAGRMVRPCLLFGGEMAGRAEAAIAEWTGLFPGSRIGEPMRHETEPGLAYGPFDLQGEAFIAMDSRAAPDGFTEAASIAVLCDGQAEVDRLWRALSAAPEAEACGWLKDRFGLSWQIMPSVVPGMMTGPDQGRADRVMAALLPMKKPDIAALEAAYAD